MNRRKFAFQLSAVLGSIEGEIARLEEQAVDEKYPHATPTERQLHLKILQLEGDLRCAKIKIAEQNFLVQDRKERVKRSLKYKLSKLMVFLSGFIPDGGKLKKKAWDYRMGIWTANPDYPNNLLRAHKLVDSNE